jgi:hypothetical protein
MRMIMRTAVLLFLAITLLAAAPGITLASCPQANGIEISKGTESGSFTWTFSLLNLTSSNVRIGDKGTTDSQSDNYLHSGFPYSTVFPPGNSTNSKTKGTPTTAANLNLTTWKSSSEKKMFPDHCSTTVPFEITNDRSYDFSLIFQSEGGGYQEHAVRVNIQPPFGTSSWKYNTNVSSNGYVAIPSASTGDGGEGILFAISDKYILSVFKNQTYEPHGGADLVLVVTERNSANDYHGNKVRWTF